jgi:hypothetical protein
MGYVVVGLPAAELVTGMESVPVAVALDEMKVTVMVQVLPGVSVPHVVVLVKLLELDEGAATCWL